MRGVKPSLPCTEAIAIRIRPAILGCNFALSCPARIVHKPSVTCRSLCHGAYSAAIRPEGSLPGEAVANRIASPLQCSQRRRQMASSPRSSPFKMGLGTPVTFEAIPDHEDSMSTLPQVAAAYLRRKAETCNVCLTMCATASSAVRQRSRSTSARCSSALTRDSACQINWCP